VPCTYLFTSAMTNPSSTSSTISPGRSTTCIYAPSSRPQFVSFDARV
jgi:hypothetical protein